MREHTLTAGDVRLRVTECGRTDAPSIVMIHGLRDVAMSLAPIFEPLAATQHIVAPDLRGHGGSSECDHYTMDAMVEDLHTVIESFDLVEPVLWGHSLGGHVATRYGAMHPDQVSAVIAVEGLGPPAAQSGPHGQTNSPPQRAARRLAMSQRAKRPARPLPSVEFAAGRLTQNNPRLAPELAEHLARHLTRTDANGQFRWAFDPRVQQVFLDADIDQNLSVWRRIACPVLIISGELANEYWASAGIADGDGTFTDADLRARRAAFKHGHWCTIAGAGHMIHYDKPTELLAQTKKFLAGLHS